MWLFTRVDFIKCLPLDYVIIYSVDFTECLPLDYVIIYSCMFYRVPTARLCDYLLV